MNNTENHFIKELDNSNEPRKNNSINKKIFGLVRDNVDQVRNVENPTVLSPKNKKRKKEGNFNTGRWQPEEHRRFIEALLKFGNEWKRVYRYVATRSRTQVRSHAQKFLAKMGKSYIGHLDVDQACNSLRSLKLSPLDDEQILNSIKVLYKLNSQKEKTESCINQPQKTNTTVVIVDDVLTYIP
jgi:SHAQKYF class myb-like DNA-binding protein